MKIHKFDSNRLYSTQYIRFIQIKIKFGWKLLVHTTNKLFNQNSFNTVPEVKTMDQETVHFTHRKQKN
jgi:hypothetical protein